MTIQVHIVGTSVPCCAPSLGSASAHPNAAMLPPSAHSHSKVNLSAGARAHSEVGRSTEAARISQLPSFPGPGGSEVFPQISTIWSMDLCYQMTQGRQEQAQGRTVHHSPLLCLLPSRKESKLELKVNRTASTNRTGSAFYGSLAGFNHGLTSDMLNRVTKNTKDSYCTQVWSQS